MQAARRDDELAVLEGVHALKHAIRFGATILRVASPDPAGLASLLTDLGPDVTVPVEVEVSPPGQWQVISGGGLPSPVIAVATRPTDHLDAAVAIDDQRPVVALEDPSHLGNIGAAVRVAAAADAAALVVLGRGDPWHPRAIRGGAGLQFALPVGHRQRLVAGQRPLVAVTPDGLAMDQVQLPRGAVLAFGTERGGLSQPLRARADMAVRLPMRDGVSSLNLATSVAALLYGACWAPRNQLIWRNE